MTKEEYNAIVGMVELLGYQYCERNKIRLGTDTEFKRGLDEALKVIKKFIERPHHHTVIDRKDNIVDLDKVWHDATEKPYGGKVVLIDTCDGYIARTLASRSDEKWRCLAGIEKWRSFVDIYIVKRWAYIDDLLPKGGE